MNNFWVALANGQGVKPSGLAAAAGTCRNTIYEAVNRGEILATRIGRRVIIPAHEARRVLGLPQLPPTNPVNQDAA